MEKIEFSVGDKVTYKSLNQAYIAIVKTVRQNPITDSVEYKLKTISGVGTPSINVVVTGRLIAESELFVNYKDEFKGCE